MALTKDQEDLYRKTMEEAKAQLETIDDEMEKEIQRARERLAKLQESKRSYRQLYEGAARLLGIKVEIDEEENEKEDEKSKNKSPAVKDDSADQADAALVDTGEESSS